MFCVVADFKEVREIRTPEELERFLMDHGEQIIDTLGQEVDRIERNIKVSVDGISKRLLYVS